MTEQSDPLPPKSLFTARVQTDALERLLAELQHEFPHFRIREKRDSLLNLWIDRLLRMITLGGQARYMSHYHTVIGSTLYVPPTWHALPAIDKVILLRHERVHLRQRRRLSFVGMAVIYLIPFFPLGLALGRARLEWEAYAETLRATAELKGLDAARDPRLRASIVSRFTGPEYGWMWPFPRAVELWYERLLESLPSEVANAANLPQ